MYFATWLNVKHFKHRVMGSTSWFVHLTVICAHTAQIMIIGSHCKFFWIYSESLCSSFLYLKVSILPASSFLTELMPWSTKLSCINVQKYFMISDHDLCCMCRNHYQVYKSEIDPHPWHSSEVLTFSGLLHFTERHQWIYLMLWEKINIKMIIIISDCYVAVVISLL